jgi:hypothetical protein
MNIFSRWTKPVVSAFKVGIILLIAVAEYPADDALLQALQLHLYPASTAAITTSWDYLSTNFALSSAGTKLDWHARPVIVALNCCDCCFELRGRMDLPHLLGRFLHASEVSDSYRAEAL